MKEQISIVVRMPKISTISTHGRKDLGYVMEVAGRTGITIGFGKILFVHVR